MVHISDPDDFYREHVPQSFDDKGMPISALARAAALTPEATADAVRAILMLVSASRDALETDAVLTEISERTRRKFKTGTLKEIIREIQREGRRLALKPEWVDHVIKASTGEPLPLASNVLVAFREAPEWQGVLGFDEFHQRPTFLKKPPWANGHWKGVTAFADADENRALVWVQEAGIHCRVEAVRQALSIAIDDNRFHPVRDYLDSLIWDGKPRLDSWLTYYLGVEPIPNYTEAIAARWMIGAVARIYEPGCLAKYCLILEGEQDLKKSSALEALGSPWFTDDVAELGTKDAAMQIGNAWIVELSELDSVRRAHISAIKGFISRKTDKFRKPFGRYIIEQPRQCAMAGTVNPSTEYLADDTGGVRFWPVHCTAIDLESLRRDRDQLWAEAKTRYQAGEPWWLDVEEMVSAAAEQVDQRFAADSWEEPIARWIHSNAIRRVTTSEVLSAVFDLHPKDHDKPKQTRIGIILRRRLGWVVRQNRVNGVPTRWYEPK